MPTGTTPKDTPLSTNDIEELNNLERTHENKSKRSVHTGRASRDIALKDVEVPPPIVADEARAKTADNAEYGMWASFGGVGFIACSTAVEQLPSKQYTIQKTDDGRFVFNVTGAHMDGLIDLPDSAAEEVMTEIEHFWTKKQQYQDHGFIWKRGVFLYGPPGSGKTSCLQQLSSRVIARGGLAIYVTNPRSTAGGLATLRQIEPDRPIVLMFEDLDAIIESFGEDSVLSLLDGEHQVDNVVNVATTNYPERLDRRITNRPSRFDIVKKIGMPNEEARRAYVNSKRSVKDEMSERMVADTKNLSIASIKELIVAVDILELDYDVALKRVLALNGTQPKSTDTDTKVGFC